jgi:hypothetical protein
MRNVDRRTQIFSQEDQKGRRFGWSRLAALQFDCTVVSRIRAARTPKRSASVLLIFL